uniref:Uncharacterized protein n=1 Tax=Caenorhabditis japonica TaxID=281687 RepID=A0A8R1ENZ6_CAEJA
MTWMTWMTQIAAIKAERTRQSTRQVNFVTGPTPAAAFVNMAKKTSAAAATEAHAPPPGEGLPQMLSVMAMDTSDGSGLLPGEDRATPIELGTNEASVINKVYPLPFLSFFD